MRTKTEVVTSISALTACAKKWLTAAIGEVCGNWNNDRFGYVANLINNGIGKKNWLENVEQVSLYFDKSKRTKTQRAQFVRTLGIVHSHGDTCNAIVINQVNILMIHLALKGHINLRYGHQIMLPQRPEAFEPFYNRGLVSDGVAHIYMASTPTRYEYFRTQIPFEFSQFLDELGLNHRSTRQRTAQNVLEAMTYFGVGSLKNITIKTLSSYFIVNAEAQAYYLAKNDTISKASDVTYNLFLKMLDDAYGSNLIDEWESLRISRALRVNESNLFEPKEICSVRTLDTLGQVSKFTCDSLNHKDFAIDTFVKEVTLLSFGDFTFSVKKDLSMYRPDNLLDQSYWKTTQVDYINTSREASTRKAKSIKLTL